MQFNCAALGEKQAAQAADFGTAPDVERRSFKN